MDSLGRHFTILLLFSLLNRFVVFATDRLRFVSDTGL